MSTEAIAVVAYIFGVALGLVEGWIMWRLPLLQYKEN